MLMMAYSSKIVVSLNGICLISLLRWKHLVVLYQVLVQIILVSPCYLIFFFASWLENVDSLTHMVAAFKSPAVRILCCVVHCHSSTSFFRHMIGFVPAVHVLLHEVAALVLEVFAVERQQLCEETGIDLFPELVDRVAVDEVALSRSLSVQVEEGEVPIFRVRVQYYLFDCVYCALLARRRVDIAAIEVDAVRVYSEMSSGHAVWVEDGKDVEDESVSKQLSKFSVPCELVDNASHHMRARHFAWMHSRSNHDHLLLALKLLRLLRIRKQQSIIKALLSLSNTLHRCDCKHFYWSSLKRVNDRPSVKVHILIDLRALGDVLKKGRVVLIGPGEVNGEVVFLVGRKLMCKSPLNLIISVNLRDKSVTMLVKLTLCETLFHSLLLASLTTGTSPSYSSLD